MSDMKEKLKILTNEVEVLRGESSNKDKMISKASADFNSVKVQRDQLRNELNKEVEKRRAKQVLLRLFFFFSLFLLAHL